VLDNAEHVIGETARAVDLLLRGGPGVRILTTSRERLGVDGEHVWTVAPLGAAGTEAPGCRLFAERARAAVTGLDLAADDELVARIVRRLDGLPLAIEMAAAQLATTSLEELADALDERVDALRSPRRDVADRHRSLAAVLAWSEERLGEDEATILAELSVFAGPVAAADIAGVLGRPGAADIARSLAARSLVSVDRSTSPARFQLLFTVRDFAGRKLAETGRDQELAGRHAAWFLDAAAQADRQLRAPGERAAHRRIEAIFAELRAAHRWARVHDPRLAVTLSEHLQLFASTRLAGEPLLWAETLAHAHAGDLGDAPPLLTAVATRALTRGDLPLASSLAGRAAERAGRTPARLAALDVLCDAAMYGGRLEDSIAASEELRGLAEELGDAYYAVVGRCGGVMAAAYMGAGRGAEALAALDPLAGRDDLPPSARGWLAYTCGEVMAATDPEGAFTAYDDALAMAGDVGNRLLGGVALVSSCSLRARVGDVGRSLSTFAEAIRHWEELADRTHQLTTLRNLAVLLERADEPDAAAELLGAVDRTDVPTYGEEAARLEAVRAWTHARLGADRARRLAELGSARDISAAARWALDVVSAVERRPKTRSMGAMSPGVDAGVGVEP
jgi:predicted ATPase